MKKNSTKEDPFMSYDVIILGGGPAGMSAALNVRARGRSALVVSNPLQENPLWQAEKVDNHLGMPAQSGAEMLTNLRRHAESSGAVFREGRVVSAMALEDTWYVSIGTEMETARALVLASGVQRGRKFPGEAEFLSSIGCSVTYFEKPRTCVIEGGSQVERVTVNGETVECACVFLLRPAMAPTDLFPGLEVEGSFVKVDRKMATNLPGLFAAGDCTGGPLQVSKAIGEGLIAGQSAAIYISKK